MFDLKDAEIKDEEAEMILQNRKWCHYVPGLLANLISENKMVSAEAVIWWGSGNDFAKQEVMSLIIHTARKFDPWKLELQCGFQVHKSLSWN